jgi:hypothetical protein
LGGITVKGKIEWEGSLAAGKKSVFKKPVKNTGRGRFLEQNQIGGVLFQNVAEFKK